MHKRLLFLFWFLVAVGVSQEFSLLTSDTFSGSQYGIVLYCSLLLLLYLLPAAFLLGYLLQKWQLTSGLLWTSLLAGAFIAGSLASYGNGGVDALLGSLKLDSQVFDSLGAMSAPIIEEPVKLLAALLSLQVLGLKLQQPRQVLLVGIGAGLGFQIIEDFSYILSNTSEGLTYSLADVFIRITGGLVSHWLYTALVVYGLYLLRQGTDKASKRQGWTFLLGAFFLHLIWNSPLLELNLSFPLFSALLAAIGIYLLAQAYQQADQSIASKNEPI